MGVIVEMVLTQPHGIKAGIFRRPGYFDKIAENLLVSSGIPLRLFTAQESEAYFHLESLLKGAMEITLRRSVTIPPSPSLATIFCKNSGFSSGKSSL